MSADNWAICPRCKRLIEQQREAKRLEVQAAYGSIPQEQWIKELQESVQQEPLEETLREDYHIGIHDDGQFEVSYSARCTTCDFTFQFRKKQWAGNETSKE